MPHSHHYLMLMLQGETLLVSCCISWCIFSNHRKHWGNDPFKKTEQYGNIADVCLPCLLVYKCTHVKLEYQNGNLASWMQKVYLTRFQVKFLQSHSLYPLCPITHWSCWKRRGILWGREGRSSHWGTRDQADCLWRSRESEKKWLVWEVPVGSHSVAHRTPICTERRRKWKEKWRGLRGRLRQKLRGFCSDVALCHLYS